MPYDTQPTELDSALLTRIENLCAKGAAAVRDNNFDDAVVRYCEAFGLLPVPVERWEVAHGILTALGDVYFKKGDYTNAADVLVKAIRTPGAKQNPLIRLRRGQIALENGQLDRAEQEMAAAYRIEGESIFKKEDPKYWAFLEPKLFPPEA